MKIKQRGRRMRVTAGLLALFCLLSGCAAGETAGPAAQPETVRAEPAGEPETAGAAPQRGPDAVPMPLQYATQFRIDQYPEGYSLVTIEESGQFLVVPEGQEPPTGIGLGENIPVLQQPVENIYLAASSAMCLFDALGTMGNVTMSGTQADGWYIESAKAAMESGELVYAGKYNAPDYEMILAKGCELAVESTMIAGAPEVKEKLADLGVPVLMERSSYEPHPLGRTEWIKLYGLLTGEEELAARLFEEQAALLSTIPGEPTGKTVAFLYINPAGNAVVRKQGDYVTEMIALAGGEYPFADLGDEGGTGSAELEMERFYAEAKDADVLFYSSTIDGELKDLAAMLEKSDLLADFKAVQNGDVWCTRKKLFQETTGLGLFIADTHRILTEDLGGDEELSYLYRLW